jgi:hypothetical protein
MKDRLDRIKHEDACGLEIGRSDFDWLIAEVENLRREVQARDHMLDTMGQKYGFYIE